MIYKVRKPVQPTVQSCISNYIFFLAKKLTKFLYHETVCGTNTFPKEKIGIWHCTTLLFSQVPKKCIDVDLSLLYILTLGTYSKFARK